jgi:condensin complex subunit 3
LGKLYFPDEVDEDKIRTLKLLLNTLQRVCPNAILGQYLNSNNRYHQRRPAKDATTNNAIIRFDKAVAKRFASQLDGFSEEDFRKLEELKELFQFLDELISDDEDDDDMPVPPKKRNVR